MSSTGHALQVMSLLRGVGHTDAVMANPLMGFPANTVEIGEGDLLSALEALELIRAVDPAAEAIF